MFLPGSGRVVPRGTGTSTSKITNWECQLGPPTLPLMLCAPAQDSRRVTGCHEREKQRGCSAAHHEHPTRDGRPLFCSASCCFTGRSDLAVD